MFVHEQDDRNIGTVYRDIMNRIMSDGTDYVLIAQSPSGKDAHILTNVDADLALLLVEMGQQQFQGLATPNDEPFN